MHGLLAAPVGNIIGAKWAVWRTLSCYRRGPDAKTRKSKDTVLAAEHGQLQKACCMHIAAAAEVLAELARVSTVLHCHSAVEVVVRVWMACEGMDGH